MDILVTGFEPFGGESTNPSMELIRALDAQIGSAHIHTAILPVTASGGLQAALRAIEHLGPMRWCAWVRRGAAVGSPWSAWRPWLSLASPGKGGRAARWGLFLTGQK